MAPTRASVESVLVRRCGRLLTAAGLDGTTISGSNADLADPIGWAARQCGLTVASVTDVADADLAGLADSDTDKLLDLAELRTLETIAADPNVTTRQADGAQVNLSDLFTRLEMRIARKRTQIQRDYGTGLGTLTAGVITLGFQETNA